MTSSVLEVVHWAHGDRQGEQQAAGRRRARPPVPQPDRRRRSSGRLGHGPAELERGAEPLGGWLAGRGAGRSGARDRVRARRRHRRTRGTSDGRPRRRRRPIRCHDRSGASAQRASRAGRTGPVDRIGGRGPARAWDAAVRCAVRRRLGHQHRWVLDRRGVTARGAPCPSGAERAHRARLPATSARCDCLDLGRRCDGAGRAAGGAGFTGPRVETLALDPPAVCVLAST